MKVDGFIKAMLVIIAGLLFLNFLSTLSFKASNTADYNASTIPFLEGSVTASASPSFIQVGKKYSFQSYLTIQATVAEIDKESGWIKSTSNDWINLNSITIVTEKKQLKYL